MSCTNSILKLASSVLINSTNVLIDTFFFNFIIYHNSTERKVNYLNFSSFPKIIFNDFLIRLNLSMTFGSD